MKKEYLILLIMGLYIFGQVLDLVGGAVSLPIKNPFEFLQSPTLSTYPFLAVSVFVKILALTFTVIFILGLFKKAHTMKAVVLFVIAAMSELYAIQQFATSTFILPASWVLSLSFTAIPILVIAFLNLLAGLLLGMHGRFTTPGKDVVWEDDED